MIRNSYILIFAACLTGISVSASISASDYEDYNYVEDEGGAFRNLPVTITDSKEAIKTTPKTNLEKTTKLSSNGTDPKLSDALLMSKMQYLFLMRGYGAPRPGVNLTHLDTNKEIYILIPGRLSHKNAHFSNDDYQLEYYQMLGSAIMSHCDCTVVGLKWGSSNSVHRTEHIIRMAISIGRELGKDIYKIAVTKVFKKPVSIISHHLGNVIASALTDIARKPITSVYALDQISLPAPFRHYYVRQDMSYLVQTVTTNGFKRNYGHRNFYPNGGNYTSTDSQCFYCQSFRLLSNSIRDKNNNHQYTFCSDYGNYVEDLCEYFPAVSYFNKVSPEALPYGNYYYMEDN